MGLSSEQIARLRLSRSETIGPVTFRQLIARFGSAAAALAAIPDLAVCGGGRVPRLASIAEVEAEAAKVEQLGARYLFLDEPKYPALLREVESAPSVLIARGNIALLEKPTIAIVGARNASAAACRFARQIAQGLGSEGYAVASGLARGIDAAAHDGSLESGTIAVIAGGIDIAYPPENAERQRAIGERGLLLAEQPPGLEPRARHFPYRNRIIAGIGLGTVIIEAALKSGSLITARLAAEFGREVMAVPGSPIDPRAQGCNQLIREGATLIQNVEEIVAALQPFQLRPLAEEPEPYRGQPPADIPTQDRERVIALLGPTAVPVDELIRQAGLAPPIVQTVLLELELAGRLERHAGGKVSLSGD